VKLRGWIGYLLSLLRIHSPDCEHCNARETCWGEMRERLEELSWRMPPLSLKSGDHGEDVGVSDSKLPKRVASPPGDADGESAFVFLGQLSLSGQGNSAWSGI